MTESPWTFSIPTRVSFGAGASKDIGALAASYGGSPIFVTDAGLAALPVFRDIVSGAPGASVFSGVEPNPTVKNVDDLAAMVRKKRHDVLIAVGGGSSMDCAKAASCLATTDEPSVRAYHTGWMKFGRVHLPVVAVPTTAGTGSEVTPFAVLDDREEGVKAPMASGAFYPVHALVDPVLTYSLPKRITAATGLDALSHAIEGYWSKNHQPVCDLLAREAARLIFDNLKTACLSPHDDAARSAMAYAALLAGMAFQLPKNAMIHACSFPLSSRYHLSHGAACAFTMEHAVRINAPHMDGRMEAFASYCGFPDIAGMVASIRELKRVGGLPCTLAEAGIPKDDVAAIVKESFHPLMLNNPKAICEEDLYRMYEELEND